MTCPECRSDVVEITTLCDDGEVYTCNGCGAHWREKDGKIVWAAAPRTVA